jgi:hypothetical protein
MDLASLHDFESIGISTGANSSSSEGEIEYILEVELKNGTSLKNDRKELKKLGKQAMSVLINGSSRFLVESHKMVCHFDLVEKDELNSVEKTKLK